MWKDEFTLNLLEIMKKKINVLGAIGEVQVPAEYIPKEMLGKLGGVLLVYVTGMTRGQIRRKVNFIKRAVREARKIE